MKGVAQTWTCPKCKWTYHSPIEITSMSHRCGTPTITNRLKLVATYHKAVTVSPKIVEDSE